MIFLIKINLTSKRINLILKKIKLILKRSVTDFSTRASTFGLAQPYRLGALIFLLVETTSTISHT